MLFQGQEIGLDAAVAVLLRPRRRARRRSCARAAREFLAQFARLATPEAQAALADPSAPRDVRRLHPRSDASATLDAPSVALHRDLLALRRDDPAFADRRDRRRRRARPERVLSCALRRDARRSAAARQPRPDASRRGPARAAARAAAGTRLARRVVERAPALRRPRHAASRSRASGSRSPRTRAVLARPIRPRLRVDPPPASERDTSRERMNDRPLTDRRPPTVDPAEPLVTREWLVTNGLGGYASGTIGGMPTRRYHGLLIAALPNPAGRVMMLNSLGEQRQAAPTAARSRGRPRLGGRRRSPRRAAAARRVPARARPAGVALRAASGIDDRAPPRPRRTPEHRRVRTACSAGGPVRLELRPGAAVPRPRRAGLDAQCPTRIRSARSARGSRSPRRRRCPPLRLHLAARDTSFVIEPQRGRPTSRTRPRQSRGYASRGQLYSPGPVPRRARARQRRRAVRVDRAVGDDR